MSRVQAGVIGVVLALAGCRPADKPAVANASVFTSLSPDKCQASDGKLLCPGIGGYQVAIATGSSTVEIVAPSGKSLPLGPVVPTPRQAEWRTSADIPVALILGGMPTTITKVSPDSACVVARLTETTATIATVHGAADSAPASPCLPPQ